MQWRTDVLTRVNNILECVCAQKKENTIQPTNFTFLQFNKAGLFAGLYNNDTEVKHLSKNDLLKKETKDPFLDIMNRKDGLAYQQILLNSYIHIFEEKI